MESLPVNLGASEDFERVRKAFTEAGFDTRNVRRVFRLLEMSDLGEADEIALAGQRQDFAVFCKLFLFLRTMTTIEVETTLDDRTLDSLIGLGLLRRAEFDIDRYYSPAFVYPVNDFVIASDLRSNPDGSEFVPRPDIVFPAIHQSTLRYLKLIANQFGRLALDLGTGSGIGALLMSRSAGRVVATDITERAVHFAEFNRRLNNCDRMTVVLADLFEPFSPLSFDCVGAHLPFIPVLERERMVFRDAGETGEDLLRKTISQLPVYLAHGGKFLSVCQGVDLADKQFQQRARDWLGPEHGEFDVIFSVVDDYDPKDYVIDTVEADQTISPDVVDRTFARFDELGIIKIVYGSLVIARRSSTSAVPLTVRHQRSE